MTYIPKGYVSPNGLAPLGAVLAYAGSGLPAKWVLCDGGAYAFTQAAADAYSINLLKELYDVIGQTYAPSYAAGVVLDSQGKFLVPNLVGRFATGDDPTGSVLNEIAPLGTQGGVNEVTLGQNELPEHYHYFCDYFSNEDGKSPQAQNITVDAFGQSLPERFGNRKGDNNNRPQSSFWNRTGTSVWFERFGSEGPEGDNPRFRFHNLSDIFYQDQNVTSANYVYKWYIPPFGGKDGGNDEPHNNIQSFLAIKYIIKAEP